MNYLRRNSLHFDAGLGNYASDQDDLCSVSIQSETQLMSNSDRGLSSHISNLNVKHEIISLGLETNNKKA